VVPDQAVLLPAVRPTASPTEAAYPESQQNQAAGKGRAVAVLQVLVRQLLLRPVEGMASRLVMVTVRRLRLVVGMAGRRVEGRAGLLVVGKGGACLGLVSVDLQRCLVSHHVLLQCGWECDGNLTSGSGRWELTRRAAHRRHARQRRRGPWKSKRRWEACSSRLILWQHRIRVCLAFGGIGGCDGVDNRLCLFMADFCGSKSGQPYVLRSRTKRQREKSGNGRTLIVVYDIAQMVSAAVVSFSHAHGVVG
jgi:hypothetical protein